MRLRAPLLGGALGCGAASTPAEPSRPLSPRPSPPCPGPEPLAQRHVASGPAWLCHELTGKSCLSLCRWRRQQRSPRPEGQWLPGECSGLPLPRGRPPPPPDVGVTYCRRQPLCWKEAGVVVQRQASARACGGSDPGLSSEPVRCPRAPAGPFTRVVPSGPHHVQSAPRSLARMRGAERPAQGHAAASGAGVRCAGHSPATGPEPPGWSPPVTVSEGAASTILPRQGSSAPGHAKPTTLRSRNTINSQRELLSFLVLRDLVTFSFQFPISSGLMAMSHPLSSRKLLGPLFPPRLLCT